MPDDSTADDHTASSDHDGPAEAPRPPAAAGAGDVPVLDASAFARSSDCDEALHEIYHLLDGELTEDTRARISAHLDDCAPCAEPYDFYGELRRVVQQRCQEQVPPSLMARIESALRSEPS